MVTSLNLIFTSLNLMVNKLNLMVTNYGSHLCVVSTPYPPSMKSLRVKVYGVEML